MQRARPSGVQSLHFLSATLFMALGTVIPTHQPRPDGLALWVFFGQMRRPESPVPAVQLA